MNFYLIQRGTFNSDGTSLTGNNGVIDLDYMGSAEFEFGAIPKSYRRIMHELAKYNYTSTGIFTKDSDELILFSNEELSSEILESIKLFIDNPYHLKEYSELEKVPYSSIKDKGYKRLRTDFWWCIEPGKDWMAFLNSKRALFEKGVNNDYNYWWLDKPVQKRTEEYEKSLRI